jgi:PAS domain S-box-containing protein
MAGGSPAVVIPLVPRQVQANENGPAPGDQAQPATAVGAPLRDREREAWVRPDVAVITPAVLWRLVDALADGIALTDDLGGLALVNSRLAEMFGYERRELPGKPVESLLPADLRAAHARFRAGYLWAPRARPMGAGARLVGLRKDGATFPVEISLSPVRTATRHFTLAVVRDVTEIRQRQDLAHLARAALAAVHQTRVRTLLDRVVSSLFDAGLSLQDAAGLPREGARERIASVIATLDATIQDIRSHVFNDLSRDMDDPAPPPNGEG